MTKTILLGDVIELIGGGTPKTSNENFWNGDIPWLSVVDFNGDARWVNNAEKTITQLGLDNSSTKLLKAGDIIISARGTVGELAQLKRPMAFNQSCYGVRAKESLVQDYLYYLLKYSIADLRRQAHGGVFSTITRETFNHVKVTLPALHTQRKIADILGTIDEKIELNRKMNETLEQMGAALFRHDFITNRESEEWERGKFSDIVNITTGKGSTKSLLTEGGAYPLYGAAGVMGSSDSFLINKDLIITGRVGTLGKVQAVSGAAWFSDNVIIIDPYDGYFGYSYYLAKSFDYKSMNRGSSQPLVTQTDIKNINIKIPKQNTLVEFEQQFRSVFNMIQVNIKETQALISVRDTLLPRLISGKVIA